MEASGYASYSRPFRHQVRKCRGEMLPVLSVLLSSCLCVIGHFLIFQVTGSSSVSFFSSDFICRSSSDASEFVMTPRLAAQSGKFGSLDDSFIQDGKYNSSVISSSDSVTSTRIANQSRRTQQLAQRTSPGRRERIKAVHSTPRPTQGSDSKLGKFTRPGCWLGWCIFDMREQQSS